VDLLPVLSFLFLIVICRKTKYAKTYLNLSLFHVGNRLFSDKKFEENQQKEGIILENLGIEVLITKIGIATLLRSAFAMIPLLARLAFFPFCHSHILSHSYCLHQDMIRLACADTKFNVIYGLVLITVLWGMDSLDIFVSYVFILHSVLRISSQEGRFKALNTCASHICAVLILYVPMIGLSVVHRFAKHSSLLMHIFMAHIYLLVPPVLNPIIYSVKTKQIRQGVLCLLLPRKISSTLM
ncbi:Olfactory receptor 51L1, partial [Camelus dromedarius]